ncbi:MAG: dimethylsulfonioproprionate lyase family protein [Hyphomicrobiaceae bacterium]
MSTRSAALQGFLDALAAALRHRAAPGSAPGRVTDRILAALAAPGDCPPHQGRRLPVCRYFEPAVETSRAAGGPTARLAEALAALEPELVWATRQGAEAHGRAFLEGHANATIVGSVGIERRDDLWIGVSLMAPGLTYPDHHHPPEEVYSVLSPGDWRQGAGPWHEPGIGGLVHNPPDIVHAMRSGEAPLLATWALWVERSQR